MEGVRVLFRWHLLVTSVATSEIVEDARWSFCATSSQVACTLSQSFHLPVPTDLHAYLERVLAANETISNQTDQGQNLTMSSAYATTNDTATFDHGVVSKAQVFSCAVSEPVERRTRI